MSEIPFPSDSTQEVRLPVETLQPLLERMLVKMCLFQFDATVAARRILEADLYGVPSHGCARVGDLIDAIDLGDVDPRGRVLTLTDAPAFAVLDGSRSLGHVAATKGAELAVAKAAEQGIGCVSVGNSQTLGAAQVYVRLMAEKGMIGLCITSTGNAVVTAPGTRHGAVGNHVIAYAVPNGDGHPLVFDSACGVEAWGKLDLLQRYGIPIPPELLVDEQGEPTGNPEQAVAMLANGGAFGFGIGLLCGTLAGPLANGKMPLQKKKRPSADDSQHLFLAFDIQRFCDPAAFQQELNTTLTKIRSLPPIDADKPVRVPGDRGAAAYRDGVSNGVRLHRSVVDDLAARARKMKLEIPW